MPERQLLTFTIGCWAAILTAFVHVAGHLAGPLPAATGAEQQLLSEIATSYRMPVPGGGERSLMDFLDGFSLSHAVLLALVGGLGLLLRARSRHDGPLMSAAARAMAAAGVVLVVISMTYWFIVPSLLLGLIAVCFLLAAVRAPETASKRET